MIRVSRKSLSPAMDISFTLAQAMLPSCIAEVFGYKRNNFNCDMVDGCQTCVKDVSNVSCQTR